MFNPNFTLEDLRRLEFSLAEKNGKVRVWQHGYTPREAMFRSFVSQLDVVVPDNMDHDHFCDHRSVKSCWADGLINEPLKT